MQSTPLQELKLRVYNLQVRLEQGSLDGALLTENMDIFYFAGSMQQGFLFIPLDREPVYLVRRNFQRALQECNWNTVLPLKSWRQLPEYLNDHASSNCKRLGLELDVLPFNQYMQLKRLFPGVEFVDISSAIREIRMLKTAYEVDCFHQAANVARKVYSEIPGLLEVGKPEVVLAAEIETLYRRAGHQGILRMRAFNMEMFFGHVYFGENGAKSTFLDSCTGGEGLTTACPQGAGWKTLAAHEPVGIDYGSIYGGYVLDHTRVFSLGSLSPELEKAYDVALHIQEKVIAMAAPGVPCADLYRLSLEIAAAHGLENYFLGFKGEQVKFVGHGLGLNVDEFPLLSRGSKHILQPGMVFALEPKFIFPGKGMIGLENVWLVTEGGTQKISLIPDELVMVPLG